jgi:hypothetical protein
LLTDGHNNTIAQECNTKKGEEELKYKNPSTEIQRMWNMKCFVIPVIIRATGIVTKELKKNLKTTIPGYHSIDT